MSLTSGAALAQAPDISGTVVDPAGVPIPGVLVAAEDREVATGADGNFRFDGVVPGAHQIRIQQAPFKPISRTVRLKAGQPARLRIVLKLAKVRSEVTVTGEAAEINTTPAGNVSAITISSDELRGLPVFGADYLSVLEEFVGGAGADPEGATVIVDGIEIDARSVPIEAIQQVRINRDPYTAEFRRPGRGWIEITTRDATAKFHGTIRAGLRDSALDARNAFAPRRPDERRRLITGNLTGPLERSGRTSFMVAVEQENENLQSLVYAQTPTGLLNLQARAPQSSSDYMVKVRRLVGDKHVLTFRFDREREKAENQGIGGARLPEVAFTEVQSENSWRAQHSAFLSASLISDLTLQYEDSRSRRESVSPGVRRLSVADAFVAGGAQVDERATEKEIGLKYVLSWSQGKHLVRGGISVPDWNWQTYQDLGNRQGTYQFASLADYAAGRPFAFTQQLGNARVSFRQRTVGIFAQDTFNVKAGLTLGLGLRYDRQNFIQDGNNVAPRLSFAWSPGQQRRTVIRGGFGLFYHRLRSSALQDILLFGSGSFRRLIVSNPAYPDPLLSAGGGTLPPAALVRAGNICARRIRCTTRWRSSASFRPGQRRRRRGRGTGRSASSARGT